MNAKGSAALWLCVLGLLGVFAVGYPGYFVFDAIWPGYYYSPIAVAKNALGRAATHDAHVALRDAAPLDVTPVALPVAEQAASLRRQP